MTGKNLWGSDIKAAAKHAVSAKRMNYLHFIFHNETANFMHKEHPEAIWDDSDELIIQHLKETNPEEFIQLNPWLTA